MPWGEEDRWITFGQPFDHHDLLPFILRIDEIAIEVSHLSRIEIIGIEFHVVHAWKRKRPPWWTRAKMSDRSPPELVMKTRAWEFSCRTGSRFLVKIYVPRVFVAKLASCSLFTTWRSLIIQPALLQRIYQRKRVSSRITVSLSSLHSTVFLHRQSVLWRRKLPVVKTYRKATVPHWNFSTLGWFLPVLLCHAFHLDRPCKHVPDVLHTPMRWFCRCPKC